MDREVHFKRAEITLNFNPFELNFLTSESDGQNYTRPFFTLTNLSHDCTKNV